MKRRTQTVSFRADEDTLRLLDQKRKAFGVSRGDWVRGVVQTQLFSDPGQADLAQLDSIAVQQIEIADGVGKLNTAMPRMLFAMLTQVGEIDAEAAREIVRKVLPT